MLLLAPINCLLGVLLGIRFRVIVLLPVTGLAVLETILLELPKGTWSSALWRGAVLIVALDFGYLIGVATATTFFAAVLDIGVLTAAGLPPVGCRNQFSTIIADKDPLSE